MKRKYLALFLGINSLLLLSVLILLVKAHPGSAPEALHPGAQVAARFFLTDLCLSTESRHTRNLSQIELIAPFQDAPGYHDHFPSSTFIAPPAPRLWSVSRPIDSLSISEGD